MKVDKKPLESKKFIALIIGVCFNALFTLAGLISIWLAPESSSDIVNLITVGLTTLNACISLYALGQSAVDWKLCSKHDHEKE
jgi:hypothetical protein